MSLNTPIKKLSIHQIAYGKLRRAILYREILPGEQIKIGELAKQFGVSSIPIREALRQLESEGLVTFSQNKRILVNRISLEDLHDIYSILIPLEEIAIDRCFLTISENDLISMEELLNQMHQEGLTRSDRIQLNWKFHQWIHHLTGSPRLEQILDNLYTGIQPYLTFSYEDNARVLEANREHADLLAALKRQDIDFSKKIMRSHLKNGQRYIEILLRQEAELMRGQNV